MMMMMEIDKSSAADNFSAVAADTVAVEDDDGNSKDDLQLAELLVPVRRSFPVDPSTDCCCFQWHLKQ